MFSYFVLHVINYGVVDEQKEILCLEQVIVVPKGSNDIGPQEVYIGTHQVPLSVGLARHSQSLIFRRIVLFHALSKALSSIQMTYNATQFPNQSVQDTSLAHIGAWVQQQPQTTPNTNSANSMIQSFLSSMDKSVVLADCSLSRSGIRGTRATVTRASGTKVVEPDRHG